MDAPDLLDELREVLRGVPDLERAISRLSLDRGGPRDLAAVRDGLAAAVDLADRLFGIATFRTEHEALKDPDGLLPELSRALGQDLPTLLRDGGFIAKNYDEVSPMIGVVVGNRR